MNISISREAANDIKMQVLVDINRYKKFNHKNLKKYFIRLYIFFGYEAETMNFKYCKFTLILLSVLKYQQISCTLT